MKRKPLQIDRDKLHAAVRKLGNEYVFYMLDDVIELLPPAKLEKLARQYFDAKQLRSDTEGAIGPRLLIGVKRFEKASLAGEYHESFNVNSKVLSSTAAPEEYATRIRDMLSHQHSYGREEMLAAARRTATPEHRKALAEIKGA